MRKTRRGEGKLVFVVMLIGFLLCMGAESPKSYGDAVVGRVLGVGGDLSFRCNIKGWPAVIGSDVKIVIKGIEAPSVITENNAADEFYLGQVKDFVEKVLKGAEGIELKHVERSREFALRADVIVDGKNIARQLVDAKLAQVKTDKPVEKKTTLKAKDFSGDYLFIASKSGKVFHRPDCSFVKRISKENVVRFSGKSEAESSGRRPCKTCKP